MANIYNGNYEVMKQEIEYLLNSIHKSNDSYDKLNLYSACELLIYSYWSANPDGINYYRQLEHNKAFILEQRNRIKRLESNSLNDFLSKKEFHLDFCERFLKGVSEIEYSDLSSYKYGNTKIAPSDKYALFIEFLENYYPNYIELFNYLVNNGRIFKINSLEEAESNYSYDASGVSIYNPYSLEYYIFVKENKVSGIELASLAHEFGHVCDYENLIDNTSKKDYSYYTFKSPFIETISSMFELEFSDFCINNHLDINATKADLQDFYLNIIYHFSELNLICNLPDYILKSDKYKNISKEKLYKIASESCELAVDCDDFCEPQELNYNYNIEYGYGRFLATYFNYLRKNNPSKFSESFDRFLKIRNGYFPENLYQELGTTIEDMSKIVKEEISSSDIKIYIK